VKKQRQGPNAGFFLNLVVSVCTFTNDYQSSYKRLKPSYYFNVLFFTELTPGEPSRAACMNSASSFNVENTQIFEDAFSELCVLSLLKILRSAQQTFNPTALCCWSSRRKECFAPATERTFTGISGLRGRTGEMRISPES